MKKITLLLLLLTAMPTLLFAGEPRSITLKDGSKINGRITGIEDGRYVVESSFGSVKVPQDDVVSILSPDQAPSAAAPGHQPSGQLSDYSQQVQAVQNALVSNPAYMAQMQQMLQDPEIQAALSDPGFLEAVKSGNLEATQNNPQTQRLLSNPKMKALIDELKVLMDNQ